LLTKYKRSITTYELIPSTGGCFELTVGGTLLYSKRRTGEFPNEAELVEKVGSHLDR
jgi:selenoprotein W-related protein